MSLNKSKIELNIFKYNNKIIVLFCLFIKFDFIYFFLVIFILMILWY